MRKQTYCEECENGKPLKGDVLRCMAEEKKGFNFTKKKFSTCHYFTAKKKPVEA